MPIKANFILPKSAITVRFDFSARLLNKLLATISARESSTDKRKHMDGAGVALLIGMFTTYGLTDNPARSIVDVGVDHLRPTKDDRQIKTTNLNAFLLEKRFESVPLTLKLGGMLSHSTGSITQLTGSWDAGTLRSETMKSPGNGIGPAVEASLRLWQGESRWKPTLTADVLTGLLIYDRRFPAGGDFYNGTFQAGPSIKFQPGREDIIHLGYRITHTSNGQGLSANNPGYNAQGLTLRWQHLF